MARAFTCGDLQMPTRSLPFIGSDQNASNSKEMQAEIADYCTPNWDIWSNSQSADIPPYVCPTKELNRQYSTAPNALL
jgi:hypothetical protein